MVIYFPAMRAAHQNMRIYSDLDMQEREILLDYKCIQDGTTAWQSILLKHPIIQKLQHVTFHVTSQEVNLYTN